MEKYLLSAQKREVIGKQVKGLRREGYLPAIVYGSGIQPIPITLVTKEISHTLSVIGANTLINLSVGDEEFLVLVRDIQRDVIVRNLLHLDFQAVSLEERITSTVPIVIVGEAPAVKEFNALLVSGLDELEIEAKAKDLPDAIHVDVSSLKEIGDHILVKDLIIPGDVKILEDPEETVFVAAAQTLMELEPEVEEGADLFEELTDAELMESEEAAGEDGADDGSGDN